MTRTVCDSVAPHRYYELLTEPAARIAAWKEEQRVSGSGQAPCSGRAGGIGQISSGQGCRHKAAGTPGHRAEVGLQRIETHWQGHLLLCPRTRGFSLTRGPLWTTPVPDRHPPVAGLGVFRRPPLPASPTPSQSFGVQVLLPLFGWPSSARCHVGNSQPGSR